MFVSSAVLVLAAQVAPTPPSPPVRPIRVAVVDCAAPGGNGLHPQPVRDLFTAGLINSGVVELLMHAAAPGTAAPMVTDGDALARSVVGSGADKVFCAIVDPQGAMPVLHAQLVDITTSRVEWSRVAPTDGSEPGVRDVVGRQAQELGSFLQQMQAARPATVAPPPAPPPPPAPVAQVTTEDRANPGFLTWKRGAGIALTAIGAALFPTSLMVLLLAGVGHMSPNRDGPPQLVLLVPGQPKPRYYAPVFTLTWADAVTTGALMLAGAGLVAAGVVLLLWPA